MPVAQAQRAHGAEGSARAALEHLGLRGRHRVLDLGRLSDFPRLKAQLGPFPRGGFEGTEEFVSPQVGCKALKQLLEIL